MGEWNHVKEPEFKFQYHTRPSSFIISKSKSQS